MDLTTKLTILGSVLAFLGLIPVFYFLFDRYIRGKITVEISEDNLFVLPIYGIASEFNGSLAIGFYDIKIKNLTNMTKTIKSHELKYEFENKVYIIDSTVLPTKSDEENRFWIMLQNVNGKDKIGLFSWKNIRPEIYKYEPLLPEGILAGSALFVLHTCKMEDSQNIKDIKFIITDSKNKVYKQTFEIKEKYFNLYNKGFKVDFNENE